MLAPAPTGARTVTVVRMWIDKFKREVLIDEDHPLARAQQALGASGTPIAPPVEALAPPGPACVQEDLLSGRPTADTQQATAPPAPVPPARDPRPHGKHGKRRY